MSVRNPPVAKNEGCNCMATRHKFRTSCQGCGWIACEKYGQKECSFCSAILSPPITADDAVSAGYDESTVKAYKMLDKLLQFDKENAQRTHVHDAQADYYESGTWLSEEEKASIDKREKLRLEAKNKRSQRKINIHFDIAGRRVVDYSAEEEDVLFEDAAAQGSCKPCSGALDNDGGRPSWMEDDAVVSGSVGNTATGTDQHYDDIDSAGVPVYENTALERNKGKAGEIYRTMKKK